MQKQITPDGEWRQVVIDGEEWPYEVSATGLVRRIKNSRILSPWTENTGYLRVRLYAKTKKKRIAVHLLVAEAFVSGRIDGFEVNHKDGNKPNNNADNLEWLSKPDNMKHAWRTGLIKAVQKPNGENHWCHRLSEKEVVKVFSLKGELAQIRIAEMFKISRRTVRDIHKGKSWKHLGLV